VETEHVSAERLLELATHDDILFTPDELEHLKTCPPCWNLWEEIIGGLPSDLI
jgi:hypothetical protein